MLNDIQSGLGYAVTSACNGEEAYTQVESTKFNMIITDLAMPGNLDAWIKPNLDRKTEIENVANQQLGIG
jgi:CheY-like chemotaxis protein